MSLAQRVTSIESLGTGSREASPPPRGEQSRKLSFNPVGQWKASMAYEEPVGAFEVSTTRRVSQVFVAIVYCLLSAGIVFGFAALKPVLVQEEVYRNYCSRGELERNVRTCFQQELRLNFMFTVAAVATNVCALPVGTILDRYGPRVTGIIGSVFVALGCLFLALAAQMSFDGYIPGYLFLALGGPFVFIPSFQLSNTTPAHSGLVLSMLTGAFDSSSAVFLIYRLIYGATGGSFTPKKFFLVYLIVPTFTLIAQITLMPAKSYKTVGELVKQVEENEVEQSVIPDAAAERQPQGEELERRESVISEITQLLGTAKGDDQAKKEGEKQRISGVWGVLHGQSALSQIMSLWFWLITIFTILQMTRINYFVATIRSQYEQILGNPEAAEAVNSFFDIALPVGGVVAVPFIGLILDNVSTAMVLALLVTMATAIGVLGVLPYLWSAYANVILFVVYRPLYYTAVSDYAAKVFGFATFGKVYGLIMCLGGLFNFSQSGLDALTHRVFNHDPVPVNIILLLTVFIVGSALVLFVWRKSRTIRRDMLEDEAEGARETLIQ